VAVSVVKRMTCREGRSVYTRAVLDAATVDDNDIPPRLVPLLDDNDVDDEGREALLSPPSTYTLKLPRVDDDTADIDDDDDNGIEEEDDAPIRADSPLLLVVGMLVPLLGLINNGLRSFILANGARAATDLYS
jgi:hypothetical protein